MAKLHHHISSPGCGASRSPAKVWAKRLVTSALVWTAVMQLMAFTEVWRPPATAGCFDRHGRGPNATTNLSVLGEEIAAPAAPLALLPRREYKSNGYLRVSCNGGLNQMRAAICDMVTIARHLNLTLVIPDLDKTSFWADTSDFGDIFDVQHFIDSLRDEVKIVRTLPPKYNRKVQNRLLSMPPISWSSENYYLKQVLPLFRKHKVVHFQKTDARLANTLPVQLQKLRCRVNYEALRFSPMIEALGRKLVSLLRREGFFVVLHLRYEMDMLSFSGCAHGCSSEETDVLTDMRYSRPSWKEKEIDSEKKRLEGLCPLTPEETALTLRALGFDQNTRIYIASGKIYGGERRMAALQTAYPNLVRKEMLLTVDELNPLRNHSNQMAALDYLVSLGSDVFIPTYDGNMAKVVEGHRRFNGFRKTILLDRRELVLLLDLYQSGKLSWDQFSFAVQALHKNKMGQPTRRKTIPDRPKEEDYFYSNPEECLEQAAIVESAGFEI